MENGLKYVSIDVEACATGRGHNDRSPCRVAFVEEGGQVLLHEVICVHNMYDPMTALTGLSREEILSGKPFHEVRASIIRLLCPRTNIIVGCHPQSDIEWMQLKEGSHFESSINISDLLKAWNPRVGNHMYFSLTKMAYGLLGMKIQNGAHSPVTDAQVSIRLYKEHAADLVKRRAASKKLFTMTCRNQFPEYMLRPVEVGDICSFKFSPQKCFCGQPTTAKAYNGAQFCM